MKSLIITAIFVVLGIQSAHAADAGLSCNFKGQDGSKASFQFDEDLDGAGVATFYLKDGSELELPVAASYTIGDKDGFMAIVVTWSSLFDTVTSALPFRGGGNSSSGPAYSITSFNGEGPKATLKGSLTCTYSENLVHTLKLK